LSDSLTPGGSTKKLVEVLNRLQPSPESVLLVGHEPHLSGLIALLVSGREAFAVVMKKGGLCKLSTESLKPGRCAALEWLLTPKQMALMS
jgi:phosphohistidine phosphatase